MTPAAVDVNCWNRIGIGGDLSCPELQTHVHCRNCPVFAAAAKGFLDRSAPEGYLDDWAHLLAPPAAPSDSKDVSLLIFRLGGEWLALASRVVVEVTTARPVHRIPRRSNETLLGMVNLRGQLQLQVSLPGLLGIGRSAGAGAGGSGGDGGAARLVVMRREGETWVFESEQVVGVFRFARGRFSAVPATLANPAHGFSQAVLSWREKSVGFLDDQRVFEALRGLCQ